LFFANGGGGERKKGVVEKDRVIQGRDPEYEPILKRAKKSVQNTCGKCVTRGEGGRNWFTVWTNGGEAKATEAGKRKGRNRGFHKKARSRKRGRKHSGPNGFTPKGKHFPSQSKTMQLAGGI